MSTAQPPQAAPAGAAQAPPTSNPQLPGRDICPLCGGPLHSEQEWCLRCGAAARTRLAAAPNWRGPAIALAVIVAISLGVLAASLVKLAGGSGSRTTITSAAAVIAPGTTAAGAITSSTAAGVTTSSTTAGVITTPTTATTPATATTFTSRTRSTSPSAAPAPGATGQARERARKLKALIERITRERQTGSGK